MAAYRQWPVKAFDLVSGRSIEGPAAAGRLRLSRVAPPSGARSGLLERRARWLTADPLRRRARDLQGRADRTRWQRLRKEPGLLQPAIEETLRFESPIARQPRRMKKSTVLGGKDIQRGEVVFQMLNAANRELERFADPEELILDGSADRHIAFGNGIHLCLGASLARLEGQVAFASLLERMPGIRLVDSTPDWALDKQNSRLLSSLPVRF
ncbi:MAG: cytochrome P450 [Chloroflexi bacterium]|nr:cytochrome P450 [Chloroflexota bacterium]